MKRLQELASTGASIQIAQREVLRTVPFLSCCCLSLALLLWVAAAEADPANPASLIQPIDNAVAVALDPLLQVDVSDPDADSLEVTFFGRQVNGPGKDFTIIAMPDTQHYTDGVGSAATFSAQTQWIAANRENLNIVFVTGLGDIVQNGSAASNDAEWVIANTAYSLLEDPLTTLLSDGIPFGLAVGNHDQFPIGGGDTASTLKYNQYFGAARFAGREYYGGHYAPAGDLNNNDNHYQLFSAGGMDFIIIHFEYDTTPLQAVLDWADGLLSSHSNRRAILTTHYMIDLGNPGAWGAQGLAIYEALKDHENLFLMLGGHRHGEGRRQDIATNGNIVNTLLSDYQDYPNGGNGYLRIMTFSPANDTIRVRTYSPTLDQYEVDDSSQFTLAYPMDGLAEFELIGSETDVASGADSSVSWPGLDWLTEYEWFVTTDDGTDGATASPVWTFTTEEQPPATVPPNTHLLSGPPDPSNLDHAEFQFDGTDNLTAPVSLDFECRLDDGLFLPCTSPFSVSGLNPGPHQFLVRAIDGDANTDPTPAEFAWLIDLTPTVVLTSRVSASSDDAEENLSSGSIDLASSDLEMVLDTGADPDRNQRVGMRFTNINIPSGSVMINAYLEFETDEVSSSATTLIIAGQAADNPVTFSNSANNISARLLTTAVVTWTPVSWDTTSVKHRSPDLSSIIQEILDRTGWTSGNAMVMVVSGTGQRIAEAFEGEAANAPLLVIEYAATPLQAVQFQQGVGNYSGTVDTFLTVADANANNSTSTILNVDRNTEKHILLRFEDIVGEADGQIPPDSLIYSAQLDIRVSDASDEGALLHRMLLEWSDTDSWNDWSNGIDADGIEARSEYDSSSQGSSPGISSLDVTADLQAWSNGETNHGWAWLPPAGDNSWQFESAEGITPPRLRVYFETPEPPVIVINEIMIDPEASSDEDGEWIELFNPNVDAVDIDGWALKDAGGEAHFISHGGALLIPAEGWLVLGRSAGSGNGGVNVDYVYGNEFSLDNSSDEIWLLDANLVEIDRVEYDGSPGFPVPAGASQSLKNPALDNNDGMNWCASRIAYGDGDSGTPGQVNTCAAELLFKDGFE